MLKIQNLRKGYARVLALEDVSFEVQRGEIFGLLGPNGAGKTTTIRIILNIIEADSGEVLFDGKPFSAELQNTVGYLPEERGLYKKSSVIDTVLYFAELRGMSRSVAKTRAMQWFNRLGLGEHSHRKVEELSKGNQQKVQFISAILHDPQLVVLDEPFSGLDPVNQEVFKEIFLELRQAGKAVIYSTHQMEQAEKLSDSLCLIDRGRAVLQGSVREVKRKYGTNSLALEFEGDPAFLETLQGVKHTILYGNSAELQLNADANLRSLIQEINTRVDLRKVELREPSLQSIFLDVVGAPDPLRKEAIA
ncbi:MAG: ATP-binding cassette domain-containing protein [Bacteroidota bacterium]